MMTTRQRKRVAIGDVLEVKYATGYSYLQYVGKHPKYGGVIRVLPRSFSQPQHELHRLIQSSAYLAFFPVGAAVLHGLARIVGSFPLPDGIQVPSRVRRAGARSTDGKVHTWIIEDDNGEYVRVKLTESERQLPIAAIWNHELLGIRISEEWYPTQDG